MGDKLSGRRLSSTVDSMSMQHLHNFKTLQSASLLRSDSSTMSLKSVSLPEEEKQTLEMGLILKAYDDCRQDTLALQVMRLLEIIWESEGVDIPLMVYNVTPARTSSADKAMGGIIECVGVFGECHAGAEQRLARQPRKEGLHGAEDVLRGTLDGPVTRSRCLGERMARNTSSRCADSFGALLRMLWPATSCG